MTCPCCRKDIKGVDEFFENERSAEADVYGNCPHCESLLLFSRRVEYSVKSPKAS